MESHLCNGSVAELNEARDRVREAQQPQFHTRFPNAAEIQSWKERQTTALAALAKIEERRSEITNQLSATQIGQAEAARELAESIQQLKRLDAEITAMKVKTK